MNLELKGFLDPGTIAKERISIKALASVDVGFFGVFQTSKTGEALVSSRIRKTFWFPDKRIDAGDLVILYTKIGVNTEQTNANGTKTHFFYWGLSSPLWENPTDAAILFHLSEWKFIARE